MLKKRRLGSQGLEVAELGLGCMGMSQSYGTPNDTESIATIHRAIGLVPFAPLGRGFLTGSIKSTEEFPEGDYRRGDPRFQGKNFEANRRATSSIQKIAEAKKATPAQIALAWLLHKGNYIVPIPGTKRRVFLEENVNATKLVLSEADMKMLDEELPTGITAGCRYNDQQMKLVDR